MAVTPGKKVDFDNDLDDLISLEKLDRDSPELWPDKLPGFNEYLAMNTTPIISSPPAWTHGLSNDDINAMHQLGALSCAGLIAEIKKLHHRAYHLGAQEAKEMTRGKFLNIFANTRKR